MKNIQKISAENSDNYDFNYQNLNQNIQQDWQVEEVLKLFSMPFSDLIFKSSSVHRQFHNPNEVQISTLLSIKTGACPENCKYCPQSAHYDTGLEKESLMAIDKILESAESAKKAGASRFCMGAAWRSLHDRDVEKICEIV
jgi:biotin synthase